jgi:hypothetical protein
MQQELEFARQCIEGKQYDKARAVLMQVQHEPMAQQWLRKLDEIAPTPKPIQRLNGGGMSAPAREEQPAGWQYAALEVKRSYGTQYRFNGAAMPDWKDQPIFYALNEVGKEGWELIGFEGREETTVYIMKKPGANLNNKKVEVWDQ